MLNPKNRYVVFSDGSVVDGNIKAKVCIASFIVYDTRAKVVYKEVKPYRSKTAKATSNMAEYLGVLNAMQYLASNGIEFANFYTDSQLVANHVNKLYRCKDSNLKVLLKKIQGIRSKVADYGVSYIPRKFNKEADKLCREVLEKYKKEKFNGN